MIVDIMNYIFCLGAKPSGQKLKFMMSNS